MRYDQFRETVHQTLRKHPDGLAWRALREAGGLPYDRPCPEWTRRLETEIGLTRERAGGRGLVWRIAEDRTR